MFTHEHSGPIIYQVVGSFPPWSLMILSGLREQPLVSPHDPMILDIHNCHYPRSACPPGSPICQLLLRHLLSHSHALDSPSSKFQIVPSRTNDLHKPLRAAKFASVCRLSIPALSNSHLRAGCQCLRCWIPRQPLFSSAYPPEEFSCVAWTVHRPAHVRQQSTLPISAPVGMAASTPSTVLDSLSKCAPRALLILLHIYSIINSDSASSTILKNECYFKVGNGKPLNSEE